jgi:prolyl oligopeptidase
MMDRVKYGVGVLLLVCLVGLTPLFAQEATAPGQAEGAGTVLHALFDREWESTLQESPTLASSLGDRRYNHLWPDVSLAAIERRHQRRLGVLTQLDEIDYNALSDEDKINYTLFRRQHEVGVEGHELADRLRFTTLKDYQDWIGRLRSFSAYMDQTLALMREGARSGVIHPRVIMERVTDQVAAQIVEDPTQSMFFKPFKTIPESFPQDVQNQLIAEAAQAISQSVIPAFRRFHIFFAREYLPKCPARVGAWQLPRGQEMYAHFARLYTTTKLTPEEIHNIGLMEVQRIRAEMEKIIKQVEFRGTFQQFLEFLRTDPQFYYSDPQELLVAYRAFSKQVDPELVKLFKTLPRMPYGVKPIPDHIAPDTTTAYYSRPAADGSRAGTYFVNLYKPEVRPKYEIEALSIHEAVPGHHLQIALAMELGDLPAFRRFGGYTAFVEGWGLYSESLGGEMGFYQDPYSKFGQLTYEMWRAVRLVVDTGMHSMQWSRQQAIDYFKANAAKTEHDIVNEIDRYVGWPGQALAYKIGELKIKELRARAQGELGEKFDIREFHDVVLGSGAVTLDILEANVNAWIVQTLTQYDP